MLIAARESFAVASRRRLPYDAEVQYLQSSGTQWIDTGIAPTNHRTVIDFSAVSLSSLGYVAGSYNTNNRRYYPCLLDRNNGIVILDRNNNIVYLRAIDTNRHTVDYYDYLGRCLFDGGTVGTISSTLAAPLNNLALFANKTASGMDAPGTVRIYGAQIYERQSQELVIDFIPVRVGTTGEMYDHITGTFATRVGAFTVGPDKTA